MAIPYPVMKRGLYTALDQVSASLATLSDSAGNRTEMAARDAEDEGPSRVGPVDLQVSRGFSRVDPERQARIVQEQENERQRALLGRLDHQTELLRRIHESIDRLRSAGGVGGSSIGALGSAVVSQVGARVLESAGGAKGLIGGVIEAVGTSMARLGNAGQVAGAVRGGLAGGALEGGGRALAAGGAGLTRLAGSRLVSALSGPLGYALVSGGIGAWHAAHESEADMRAKYGQDNAGYRVLEAGRQGLSNASFGLSEFAINELNRHAPKTSHAIATAVASSLERRIDSVRALWNPQARAELRRSYDTQSSTRAMAHALLGTMTGGLTDWFDKPGSALGRQVDRIGDAVDGFKESLLGNDGLIDRISTSFSTAFQNIDWQHVGLGEVLTRAADGVAKAVTGDRSATAAGQLAPLAARGQRAARQVRSTVEAAASKTEQVLSDVKDWALGATSKHYESGQGGAGTVSSGKGDAGGVSYGTYQMSSKKGVVQDFLRSSAYGQQFAGLEAGTAAFNERWQQVAAHDPKFAQAQHDYIKRTHFDVQRAQLARSGIDLSKRGAAVQDAVWSTAVQFGGKTSVIRDALAGKDVNALTDAQIVTAVQEYKQVHNSALFKSSSPATRAEVLKRERHEESSLLALDAAEQRARAARPTVQARAVTNPDVQQLAKASAAPAPVEPAAVAPVVQVPPAPAVPDHGRAPSDFSSIGLMLFNLSVFS